ncbi:MAG: ribonuclease HII [Lachnospiraceae bacterium]|nr:ribonuclease HII [Lachnospiraceae bacterium]
MADKKISEITAELKACDISALAGFIDTYQVDERPGVVKLVDRARKMVEKQYAEIARMDRLKQFERGYWNQGMRLVCGIDEAGRGPLAGPVVAGAVIFDPDCDILYINDSKKLSAAKREELYDEIMDKALAVGVGIATPQRIDEINILQATYEAMRMAIAELGVTPDVLLNDAVTIPAVEIPQVPIIKGDAKSFSIGAASIIAKVTRDRMMIEYDKQYPEYGFAGHKGYGTKEHYEALRTYGVTPIHRRSFLESMGEAYK